MSEKSDIIIQNTINISGEEKLAGLEKELTASRSEVEQLNRELERTVSRLDEVSESFSSFKRGSGVQALEEELERFRDTAERSVYEFRAFLESVNLNDAYGNNDYMFDDLFGKIRDGSITASQAIMNVKTNMRELMEENYNNNGGIFDSSLVSQFTTALETLGDTIGKVYEKIEFIENNGVKSIGSASPAPSGISNMASMLEDIKRAASDTPENLRDAYNSITNLVTALNDYANLDESKLLAVSHAFRNIADVEKNTIGSQSVKNIISLLKQLEPFSGKTLSVRVDFSGLENLSVRKTSLANLAEYLPKLDKINTGTLTRLSKITWDNLNNIRVSKSAVQYISDLANALALLKQNNVLNVTKGDGTLDIGLKGSRGGGGSDKDYTRTMGTQIESAYKSITAAMDKFNNLGLSNEGAYNSLKMYLEEVNNLRERFKDTTLTKEQFDKTMSWVDPAYRNAINNLNDLARAVANSEKGMKQAESDAAKEASDKRQMVNQLESTYGTVSAALDRYRSLGGSGSSQYQELERFKEALVNLRNNLNDTKMSKDEFDKKMAEIDPGYKELINTLDEGARSVRNINKAYKEEKVMGSELERTRGSIANALTRANGAQYVAGGAQAYQNLVDYQKQVDELISKLNTGKLEKSEFDEAMAKIKPGYLDSVNALKELGLYAESFGDKLKRSFASFASYFSMTRVIMALYRSMKQLVSQTIEIDSAIRELQIVTRDTDSTMEKFGDTAVATAKKIGSSVTDFLSSATTFSRLGYTLDESSKLAEYTSMLSKVGDIDVGDAQNAITAVIKAFDVDVNDIESIMNKLVITGNSFPISVSQIADGMNNASSALAAAGNTFEQSVALLTAANTTVQDASKASTGLRTITARLRNTKTELDELGEEVLTEAKYQELISTLTKYKVSLTDVNGEYRGTYNILYDIAQVWDTLDSSEQSALATAIAANRQQDVFFSIINNFKEASDALSAMQNDSENALTSAFDTYMQSAQASIDRFKTTFSQIGMDALDTNFVSGIVDFGTKLLKMVDKVVVLIDKIGGLKTALIGVAGVITTIKAPAIIFSITQTITKLQTLVGIIKAWGTIEKGFGTKEIIDASGKVVTSFKQVTLSANGMTVAVSAAKLAFGALAAIITISFAVYSRIKRSHEETIEKMKAAADAANEERESITKLIDEYKQLASTGINTDNSRERAASIQKQITDLVGAQANNLDLVNGRLEDQLAILRDIQSTKAMGNRTEFECR